MQEVDKGNKPSIQSVRQKEDMTKVAVKAALTAVQFFEVAESVDVKTLDTSDVPRLLQDALQHVGTQQRRAAFSLNPKVIQHIKQAVDDDEVYAKALDVLIPSHKISESTDFEQVKVKELEYPDLVKLASMETEGLFPFNLGSDRNDAIEAAGKEVIRRKVAVTEDQTLRDVVAQAESGKDVDETLLELANTELKARDQRKQQQITAAKASGKLPAEVSNYQNRDGSMSTVKTYAVPEKKPLAEAEQIKPTAQTRARESFQRAARLNELNFVPPKPKHGGWDYSKYLENNFEELKKEKHIGMGYAGIAVKQSAQYLAELGYDVGGADKTGLFKKKMAAAVKSFQRENHLKVDGIIGKHTALALMQAKEKREDEILADLF